MQLSNNTVSSDPNFFAQLAPGTGSAGSSESDAATGDGTQFEAVIAELEESSPEIGDEAAMAAAQSGVWLGQATPPEPVACIGLIAPEGSVSAEDPEGDEVPDTAASVPAAPGFPPGRARGLGHGIKNEVALQHAAAVTPLAPGLKAGAKGLNEEVVSADSTTVTAGPIDPALINVFGDGRVTSSREIGRFDPTNGLGRPAETEFVPPGLAGNQVPAPLGRGAFPGNGILNSLPSSNPDVDPHSLGPTLPSTQAAEESAVDAMVAAGITVKDLGAARGLKSALEAAATTTEGMETVVLPDGTTPEVTSAIASMQPVAPVVTRKDSARTDGSRPTATPANSAASSDLVLADDEASTEASDKSFVSADGQTVGPERKRLGIDSAKTSPTMFARYQPPALQHPASDYAAAAIAPVASGLDAAAAPDKALGPQSVSSAHEAVEVVLQAATQAESREQKSVSLQFRVGDADLSVRVELRADHVRTTFRTDSTELRNALSHEWQSVSASSSSGDRHIRIAPAVFTSSDQSATHDGSPNDASSRQREQHAQREMAENAFAGLRQLRGTAKVVAVPSPALAAQPSLAGRHSLHLHTHA